MQEYIRWKQGEHNGSGVWTRAGAADRPGRVSAHNFPNGLFTVDYTMIILMVPLLPVIPAKEVPAPHHS